MRFATWNVNSIRARASMVLDWLAATRPHVCALQETKCSDHAFPTRDIEALGYEVAHHGTNQWNGVALLSRVGMTDVRRGFTGPQRPPFDEPRLIAATCADVRTWSVYVPNGRSLTDPHYLYKLVWLERLRAEVLLDSSPTRLALGDFNVAPADRDIYDPRRWRRRTHASAPERAAISALGDTGLYDLAREHAPDDPGFTWWNYRSPLAENRGMRIDLALGSSDLLRRLADVVVDRGVRGLSQPSDHAPLTVVFDEPIGTCDTGTGDLGSGQ